MDKITKIRVEELPPDSPYMQPFRFFYIQNGTEKSWDLLKVHDSVSIVIFNRTSKKLIFVKQFRPAVYHGIVTSSGGSLENIDLKKYPPKIGITLELCGGMEDKENLSSVEIAREEVLEECGFDIPVDRFNQVFKYKSGVGPSGASQTMFYCEVTEADRKTAGGGVDNELIDVVECSLKDAKKYISKGVINNSPPNFLLGIQWFLDQYPKKSKEVPQCACSN
ncbi:NUDT14 family protein [Megaselia abdita]